MLAFIMLIVGFIAGYKFCKSKDKSNSSPIDRKNYVQSSFQNRLKLKAHHQSDSDRIRELNLLGTNQSTFLRQLKQNFNDHEITIKSGRFIILDRDNMPRAIFEYRDGTQPMKVIDSEDGLPLFLYKGLISSDAIKEDYQYIKSK